MAKPVTEGIPLDPRTDVREGEGGRAAGVNVRGPNTNRKPRTTSGRYVCTSLPRSVFVARDHAVGCVELHPRKDGMSPQQQTEKVTKRGKQIHHSMEGACEARCGTPQPFWHKHCGRYHDCLRVSISGGHAHTRAHTRTRAQARARTNEQTRTRAHASIRAHATRRTGTRAPAHTRTHAHAQTRARAHAHAHTHTHTHARAHAHTQPHKRSHTHARTGTHKHAHDVLPLRCRTFSVQDLIARQDDIEAEGLRDIVGRTTESRS